MCCLPIDRRSHRAMWALLLPCVLALDRWTASCRARDLQTASRPSNSRAPVLSSSEVWPSCGKDRPAGTLSTDPSADPWTSLEVLHPAAARSQPGIHHFSVLPE